MNLLTMVKQSYVKALYLLFHLTLNNQKNNIKIAKYQTFRNLLNFKRGLDKLAKKAATTRIGPGLAVELNATQKFICL